jgi:hypothetical protein
LRGVALENSEPSASSTSPRNWMAPPPSGLSMPRIDSSVSRFWLQSPITPAERTSRKAWYSTVPKMKAW